MHMKVRSRLQVSVLALYHVALSTSDEPAHASQGCSCLHLPSSSKSTRITDATMSSFTCGQIRVCTVELGGTSPWSQSKVRWLTVQGLVVLKKKNEQGTFTGRELPNRLQGTGCNKLQGNRQQEGEDIYWWHNMAKICFRIIREEKQTEVTLAIRILAV